MIKYTDYGIKAVIQPHKDGTARLTIRVIGGKKLLDKEYKTVNGAKAAWRRWCD